MIAMQPAKSRTALPCSFKLPQGMGLQNLQGLGAGGNTAATSSSGISKAFSDFVDPGLTWEFVAWLREFCSMNILVKVRLQMSGTGPVTHFCYVVVSICLHLGLGFHDLAATSAAQPSQPW